MEWEIINGLANKGLGALVGIVGMWFSHKICSMMIGERQKDIDTKLTQIIKDVAKLKKK